MGETCVSELVIGVECTFVGVFEDELGFCVFETDYGGYGSIEWIYGDIVCGEGVFCGPRQARFCRG